MTVIVWMDGRMDDKSMDRRWMDGCWCLDGGMNDRWTDRQIFPPEEATFFAGVSCLTLLPLVLTLLHLLFLLPSASDPFTLSASSLAIRSHSMSSDWVSSASLPSFFSLPSADSGLDLPDTPCEIKGFLFFFSCWLTSKRDPPPAPPLPH